MPAHRAAGLLQLAEGVRRVQFVQHMTVDVEQLTAIRPRAHQVILPDLLEQRLRHGRQTAFGRSIRALLFVSTMGSSP